MLEIIPTRREVWFCPACGDTDRVETTYWVRANARELLDEDGSPSPQPDGLARNAVVLLTDLLAGREVRPWWTAAWAEIERAQLND